MKVKQIMSTVFPMCFLEDTIEDISERVKNEEISFIIVVDEDNKYRGIIEARYLLWHGTNSSVNRDESISKLVRMVKSVSQDDDVMVLRNIDDDINVVPVVNSSMNILGYIDLKIIFKNIDKISSKNDSAYLGGNRGTSKNKAKYTIDHFIGESKPILQLKKRILAAAKTKATVLIMGETGTGKELVAHAITSLGDRRHQPFVRLNCAAIPESLLESELFGYEEGSFTGALKGGSTGKFFQANNGTIFLDEIGDMQFSLQAKILRVLQEREIERIGSSYPIPIDVRVIAATHADLFNLVKENKFRKDLFYRLHVIPITVPPLRERKEDIPLLLEYFIDKLSIEQDIEKPKIHRSFITSLMEYNWPGNVRELANLIEMAVSFSNGIITEEVISDYMAMAREESIDIKDDYDLRTTSEEAEKDRIQKAMETYDGNKNKVAKALGISRSNLYYKMKKLNI